MSKTITYNDVQYDKTSLLFSQMYDDGLTRDQAIITAVQAGLTLNTATKHYAMFAKEVGLTTQLVSHKSEALDLLAEKYKGKFTLDNAHEAIPLLVEKFGVAESTARDYAKAYCDRLDVTYPVQNPRELIFAWFLDRKGKEITKKEFLEFAVDELKRSDSNANEYWKGYELHIHLSA